MKRISYNTKSSSGIPGNVRPADPDRYQPGSGRRHVLRRSRRIRAERQVGFYGLGPESKFQAPCPAVFLLIYSFYASDKTYCVSCTITDLDRVSYIMNELPLTVSTCGVPAPVKQDLPGEVHAAGKGAVGGGAYAGASPLHPGKSWKLTIQEFA